MGNIMSDEEARERIQRYSPGALERIEQHFNSLAIGPPGFRAILFSDFRRHFLEALLPQIPEVVAESFCQAIDRATQEEWTCPTPGCRAEGLTRRGYSACYLCQAPGPAGDVRLGIILQGFAVVLYGDDIARETLLEELYRQGSAPLDQEQLQRFAFAVDGESYPPQEWMCLSCREYNLAQDRDCHNCLAARPELWGRELLIENLDRTVVQWIHQLRRAFERAEGGDCASSDVSPADESLTAPRGSLASIGRGAGDECDDADDSESLPAGLARAPATFGVSGVGVETQVTLAVALEVLSDSMPPYVVRRLHAAIRGVPPPTGGGSPPAAVAGGEMVEEENEDDQAATVDARALLAAAGVVVLRSPTDQFQFAFRLYDADDWMPHAAWTQMLRAMAAVELLHRTPAEYDRPGLQQHLPRPPRGELTLAAVQNWVQTEGADFAAWLGRLGTAALAERRPESVAEERRLIARLNAGATSDPRGYRYIVAREWWSQWKADPRAVGEIDNSPLLSMTGELSRHINKGDFVILTDGAYRALESWCGVIGPPIIRRFVRGAGPRRLELYPPCVVVVLGKGHVGSLTGPRVTLGGFAGLSIESTMGDVLRAACREFSVDPARYDLYDAEPAEPDPDVGWRVLAASDITLERLEHVEGHVFVLVERSLTPGLLLSPHTAERGPMDWKNADGYAHLEASVNTCFLDACLQALISCRPLVELFSGRHMQEIGLQRSASLPPAADSSGGKVAMALARLLERSRCLPRLRAEKLLEALRNHPFTQVYTNNEQHDADGFWLKLTEVLAGDLRTPPPPELLEASGKAGEGDEARGSRLWADHLASAHSIVNGLTASQHRRMMRCNVCHTDQPSEFGVQEQKIMLTALQRQLRYINVRLVRSGGLPVLLLRVGLDENKTLADLLQTVASLPGVDELPENMAAVEGPAWGRYLGAVRSEEMRVAVLPTELAVHCAPSLSSAAKRIGPTVAEDWACDKCTLLNPVSIAFCQVCQAPRVDPPKIDEDEARSCVAVRLLHRRSHTPGHTTSFRRMREHLFGSPTCVVVAQKKSGAELYARVEERVRHLVVNSGSPQRTTDPGTAGFKLRRVHADGSGCSVCPWYLGCTGCLIWPDSDPVKLKVWETLALDWGMRAEERPVEWKEHESRAQSFQEEGKEKQLELCIARTYPETEQVYHHCTKCGGSTQMTARRRLWRLPPLLILTLPRQPEQQKNEAVVRFPLRGLDMGPFTDKPTGEVETLPGNAGLASRDPGMYDLWAVINHKGHSVTFGHYVAAVRSGSRWFLHDDLTDRSLEIPPADVCTREAYILFYMRRDFRRSTLAEALPVPIGAPPPVEECEVIGEDVSYLRDRGVLSCPPPDWYATPRGKMRYGGDKLGFHSRATVTILELDPAKGVNPLADDAFLLDDRSCARGSEIYLLRAYGRDQTCRPTSSGAVLRNDGSKHVPVYTWEGTQVMQPSPEDRMRSLAPGVSVTRTTSGYACSCRGVSLGLGELPAGLEQAIENMWSGQIARVRVRGKYLRRGSRPSRHVDPTALEGAEEGEGGEGEEKEEGEEAVRWYWVHVQDVRAAEDLSPHRDGSLLKRVLCAPEGSDVRPRQGDKVLVRLQWHSGSGYDGGKEVETLARLEEGKLPVAVEKALVTMCAGHSAQVKGPARLGVADADLAELAEGGQWGLQGGLQAEGGLVRITVELREVEQAPDPVSLSLEEAARCALMYIGDGDKWRRAAQPRSRGAGSPSRAAAGVEAETEGTLHRLQARAREAYRYAAAYAERAEDRGLLGRAKCGSAETALASGSLALAERLADEAALMGAEGAADVVQDIRLARQLQSNPMPPKGLTIITRAPGKNAHEPCLVVDASNLCVMLDFTVGGRRAPPFDGQVVEKTIQLRDGMPVGWELDPARPLRIASVRRDSPAGEVGVQATWTILSVDGESMLSNAEVEERMLEPHDVYVKFRTGAERVTVPIEEWTMNEKKWELYSKRTVGISDCVLCPGTNVIDDVREESRAEREGLARGWTITAVHVQTPQKLETVIVKCEDDLRAAIGRIEGSEMEVEVVPPACDWRCAACGRMNVPRSHCAEKECQTARCTRTAGECPQGHPLVESRPPAEPGRLCCRCLRFLRKHPKVWRCSRCDHTSCASCAGMLEHRRHRLGTPYPQGMLCVAVDEVATGSTETRPPVVLLDVGDEAEVDYVTQRKERGNGELKTGLLDPGSHNIRVWLFHQHLVEPSLEWTGMHPLEDICGEYIIQRGHQLHKGQPITISATESGAFQLSISSEACFNLRVPQPQDHAALHDYVWETRDAVRTETRWTAIDMDDERLVEEAYQRGDPVWASKEIGKQRWNTFGDLVRFHFTRPLPGEVAVATARQTTDQSAAFARDCRRRSRPFNPHLVADHDTGSIVIGRLSENLLQIVFVIGGTDCTEIHYARRPRAEGDEWGKRDDDDTSFMPYSDEE
eukprot:Hpha_TRINITY_DN16280_c1_g8::TRINITY_DN16280_c1_g8_i1::g.16204::m.16204